MSTSSTSSASASTSSGRRSRTGAPVIVSTAVGEGLEVLDVERADDVDPGVPDPLDVLVALLAGRSRGRWCGPARRSRATVGRRRMTASVSRSSTATRPGTPAGAGARPRGRRSPRPSAGRPWVSTKPTTTSVPRASAGDAPPRASGTSCPRPGPCRGRPAAARGRRGRRPRGSGRASRRPTAARRRRRAPGPGPSVSSCRSQLSSPSRSRLSSRTCTTRLAEEPEERLLGVPGDGGPDVRLGHAARGRDAGHLVLGGRRADVRVEARRRGGDQVDRAPARRRWRPPRARRRR